MLTIYSIKYIGKKNKRLHFLYGENLALYRIWKKENQTNEITKK